MLPQAGLRHAHPPWTPSNDSSVTQKCIVLFTEKQKANQARKTAKRVPGKNGKIHANFTSGLPYIPCPVWQIIMDDKTCSDLTMHTFLTSNSCLALLAVLWKPVCGMKHLAQLGSGLGLQAGLTNRHLSPPTSVEYHVPLNEALPWAVNKPRCNPKTHTGNVSWP